MHYVPEKAFTYSSRYNDTDKVMVILNANEAPTALEPYFSQMLEG